MRQCRHAVSHRRAAAGAVLPSSFTPRYTEGQFYPSVLPFLAVRVIAEKKNLEENYYGEGMPTPCHAGWSMMPSCSYCGQEFATPTQRMLHEERMHLNMDGGSEKDSMFHNGHPMDIAWQLLKVDKPIMPDLPSDDDDDDDDDFNIADMLREALSGAGFQMGDEAEQSDERRGMSPDEFFAMKEAEEQRIKEMNEGERERPFAMIPTKELRDNLNWLVKPEHREERQQVFDELNLRGQMQTDPENDIRGWQFSAEDAEQGFGSMNAEERRNWQDEMKGEPFDIAWQMLKAPIMPESVKMTENTPERQVWSGDFFDPQTGQTYPTRLRWDKQADDADVAMFQNAEDMAAYDQKSHYERGASQGYGSENAPLSRFSMERSMHGMGSGVKVPFFAPRSRADLALRTDHRIAQGRKGLATGLMEMIPYWLMANPDIAFNPMTDGFSQQGLQFTTKSLAKLAQNNPALYQKLMVERQPSEAMRYWMGQLGNPNHSDTTRDALMYLVSKNPEIEPNYLSDLIDNMRQELQPDGLSRVRDLNENVEPCTESSDGQHRWRTKYDRDRNKIVHVCRRCYEKYYEDKELDMARYPERYGKGVGHLEIRELMRRLLSGEVLNDTEMAMLENAQQLRQAAQRRGDEFLDDRY